MKTYLARVRSVAFAVGDSAILMAEMKSTSNFGSRKVIERDIFFSTALLEEDSQPKRQRLFRRAICRKTANCVLRPITGGQRPRATRPDPRPPERREAA